MSENTDWVAIFLDDDSHFWTEDPPYDHALDADCGRCVVVGDGEDYECERPAGHEGRCGQG